MKVIAKNSFHGTEASLNVKSQVISAATAKTLRKKLCASNCNCFWNHTQFFEHIPGYRNSENRRIKLYKSQMPDGGILLEQ